MRISVGFPLTANSVLFIYLKGIKIQSVKSEIKYSTRFNRSEKQKSNVF